MHNLLTTSVHNLMTLTVHEVLTLYRSCIGYRGVCVSVAPTLLPDQPATATRRHSVT